MFGIGETEFLIIVLFGFLLFGPERLPGMGKTFGRMLRQFREAQDSLNKVVQTEIVQPLNDTATQEVEAPDSDDDLPEIQAPTKASDTSAEDAPKKETFAQKKARIEAQRKGERLSASDLYSLSSSQPQKSSDQAADKADETEKVCESDKTDASDTEQTNNSEKEV